MFTIFTNRYTFYGTTYSIGNENINPVPKFSVLLKAMKV